jgi:protein SCO1/2
MTPTIRHGFWLVLLTGLLLGPSADPAWGQRSSQPRAELDGVGVEPRLGASVPADLAFRDDTGRAVELAQYLDGSTPVILNLVYHSCPMLCGLMLDGFTASLRALDWTPGQEFRVLTVSFNPREGPAVARERKAAYTRRLDRSGAAEGWHFLTGEEAAIRALTAAVGVRVRWVPEKQEYAHPTTLIFLSGTGTVTRYIHGIEVPGGDLRKALVEASGGAVGTVIDRAVMYCFQFDPTQNTYTANAFNLMKIGGAFTVLLLGGALFVFWRREHEALEAQEQWGDPTLPS